MLPVTQQRLTGGRSSVSGLTATVFGATGVLGQYVVIRRGTIGCRVRCPHRGDDVDARHLKLAGDLGMVQPYQMSIRSLDEIQEAVAGSNIVINLLGKHFETSRWSFLTPTHFRCSAGVRRYGRRAAGARRRSVATSIRRRRSAL